MSSKRRTSSPAIGLSPERKQEIKEVLDHVSRLSQHESPQVTTKQLRMTLSTLDIPSTPEIRQLANTHTVNDFVDYNQLLQDIPDAQSLQPEPVSVAEPSESQTTVYSTRSLKPLQPKARSTIISSPIDPNTKAVLPGMYTSRRRGVTRAQDITFKAVHQGKSFTPHEAKLASAAAFVAARVHHNFDKLPGGSVREALLELGSHLTRGETRALESAVETHGDLRSAIQAGLELGSSDTRTKKRRRGRTIPRHMVSNLRTRVPQKVDLLASSAFKEAAVNIGSALLDSSSRSKSNSFDVAQTLVQNFNSFAAVPNSSSLISLPPKMPVSELVSYFERLGHKHVEALGMVLEANSVDGVVDTQPILDTAYNVLIDMSVKPRGIRKDHRSIDIDRTVIRQQPKQPVKTQSQAPTSESLLDILKARSTDLIDLFALSDTSGNLLLDDAEFHQLLTQVSPVSIDTTVSSRLFKELDEDGNGQIDAIEFISKLRDSDVIVPASPSLLRQSAPETSLKRIRKSLRFVRKDDEQSAFSSVNNERTNLVRTKGGAGERSFREFRKAVSARLDAHRFKSIRDVLVRFAHPGLDNMDHLQIRSAMTYLGMELSDVQFEESILRRMDPKMSGYIPIEKVVESFTVPLPVREIPTSIKLDAASIEAGRSESGRIDMKMDGAHKVALRNLCTRIRNRMDIFKLNSSQLFDLVHPKGNLGEKELLRTFTLLGINANRFELASFLGSVSKHGKCDITPDVFTSVVSHADPPSGVHQHDPSLNSEALRARLADKLVLRTCGKVDTSSEKELRGLCTRFSSGDTSLNFEQSRHLFRHLGCCFSNTQIHSFFKELAGDSDSVSVDALVDRLTTEPVSTAVSKDSDDAIIRRALDKLRERLPVEDLAAIDDGATLSTQQVEALLRPGTRLLPSESQAFRSVINASSNDGGFTKQSVIEMIAPSPEAEADKPTVASSLSNASPTMRHALRHRLKAVSEADSERVPLCRAVGVIRDAGLDLSAADVEGLRLTCSLARGGGEEILSVSKIIDMIPRTEKPKPLNTSVVDVVHDSTAVVSSPLIGGNSNPTIQKLGKQHMPPSTPTVDKPLVIHTVDVNSQQFQPSPDPPKTPVPRLDRELAYRSHFKGACPTAEESIGPEYELVSHGTQSCTAVGATPRRRGRTTRSEPRVSLTPSLADRLQRWQSRPRRTSFSETLRLHDRRGGYLSQQEFLRAASDAGMPRSIAIDMLPSVDPSGSNYISLTDVQRTLQTARRHLPSRPRREDAARSRSAAPRRRSVSPFSWSPVKPEQRRRAWSPSLFRGTEPRSSVRTRTPPSHRSPGVNRSTLRLNDAAYVDNIRDHKAALPHGVRTAGLNATWRSFKLGEVGPGLEPRDADEQKMKASRSARRMGFSSGFDSKM